jgi:hypothetical protein
MPTVRLIAGVVLLTVAAFLTWSTIGKLDARRSLRTDLAELGHVRYGLLNADVWIAQLTPILDARIDALDLTAENQASLRPMVQKALYRLLDEVKEKMSAPAPKGAAPATGGGGFFSVAGNPMVVNMIVGALRPQVPQFTDIVMRELGGGESKAAIRAYLKGALAEGAKATFGAIDLTTHNAILEQHGCRDAASCKGQLSSTLNGVDLAISTQYLAVLGSGALAFLLLLTAGPILRPAFAIVLMLFCIVLLLGGILTPMLEVEARISKISMTFLGAPISFGDQILYYQSKSVLEVFRTLINQGQLDMWIVGVLVLMFSVVFPTLKLLASTFYLWKPAVIGRNRIVKWFALESSKWSMADVMALAIFMAFVAFNGLIANTMGGLRETGAQVVIPTDSSKILPGYHLFIGFCLASLFLSRKLGKSLLLLSGPSANGGREEMQQQSGSQQRDGDPAVEAHEPSRIVGQEESR